MINENQKHFISNYCLEKLGSSPREDKIQDNAKIIRFRDNSKRENNQDLYLCVYPFKDELHFIGGNWRDRKNTEFSYFGGEERKPSSEEKKLIRDTIEQEERERQLTLQNYEKWFKTLPLLDDVNLPLIHPYMARKGLKRSYIARYNKDDMSLVLAFQGARGEFTGFQKILSRERDNKRIAALSRKRGSFIQLYSNHVSNNTILACEGYATGVSLFEATEGKSIVVICIDCGNLTEGIKSATEYYLQIWKLKTTKEEFYKRFLIIADNDPSNIGEEKARETSKELGCSYAVIQNYGDERITDANDYARAFGIEKLKRLLEEIK